ncbi:MAG: hypothetical protein A2W25_10740 [candidate division Zixibacteria bacterium RBG_16_53_22]|nr:MAG: hypothetical protein A2W25_10740 [candidate division Zixibacteria bacterium RBG_16_53_22]
MRINILFMSIIVLYPPAAESFIYDDLEPFRGRIIEKINIVRRNVFDSEMQNDPPFYYRWANSLHIITRENVVRRELLFGIGDSLDIQQVIETERNLRAAGFIGEIDIGVIPASDSGIELIVTTTDLWTTKVEIYLDVAGGNYTTGLAFTEANLLGLGKYIQALGQIGNDQDGYAAYYIDNRLLGSRLALSFAHVNFTYSRGISLSLARPQYSLAVPFGAGMALEATEERPRLFSGGEEFFRYHQEKRIIIAGATYTFGRNQRLSINGAYNLDKTDYAVELQGHPLNSMIPPDETISYPTVGVSIASIKYDIARFVDAAGNPEDLSLGGALKFTFGRSDVPFGADYIANYQAASARFLLCPRNGVYVGGSDKVIWWSRSGQAERIRHQSELSFYYKPAAMHLLAIHGLADFAWRQKPTYQVILGGGNGLRGYSYHELAGNRLALGNIEYRFYTPITILTVRLGAAAFFDIGNVWRRSQDIDPGELKSGVGLGLRFGLTKSSTARVVSLDFAKALSKDEFFIGFGTASPFNLKNFDLND